MKEINQFLNKVAKLRNPFKGEESMIYKITNYNEVTGRCYITPVVNKYNIPSSELVSFSELEIIS